MMSNYSCRPRRHTCSGRAETLHKATATGAALHLACGYPMLGRRLSPDPSCLAGHPQQPPVTDAKTEAQREDVPHSRPGGRHAHRPDPNPRGLCRPQAESRSHCSHPLVLTAAPPGASATPTLQRAREGRGFLKASRQTGCRVGPGRASACSKGCILPAAPLSLQGFKSLLISERRAPADTGAVRGAEGAIGAQDGQDPCLREAALGGVSTVKTYAQVPWG